MTLYEAAAGILITAGFTCVLYLVSVPQTVTITRKAKECPTLDRVQQYSTEELQRMVAARKRMERVK